VLLCAYPWFLCVKKSGRKGVVVGFQNSYYFFSAVCSAYSCVLRVKKILQMKDLAVGFKILPS